MSSSRLTSLQVHERFKQNYNLPCSRQMIPKEDLFDDSLTNLQWLQNLNVNMNQVPSVAVGGDADGSKRLNVTYRRIRPGGDMGINRLNKSRGEAMLIRNGDTPVKLEPGIQNGELLNTQTLQDHVFNGKSKARTLNNKNKNPLPPLIPQSKTPLPSQYRSRVGGPPRISQTDSLPRLSGSNDSLKLNTKLCENAIVLTASPELARLSDAANNHYVLSPRQMDRDLLPGQVDYKNNPYVKPPFSHLALICKALQHNRDKKMTAQKICDWIKNNFIYYRFVGPDWQNSIRDNLVRHKCFQRTGRRQDSAGRAGFWRIDPKYEDMFSKGMLRKRRLASAGEEKGQSSSASEKSSSRGCSPFIEQCCDYDFLRPEDFVDGEISGDDFLDNEGFSGGKKTSSAGSSNKGSAGQKRKQAAPHRITKSKKCKQQQRKQTNKVNLFEDQAPELGSLKGEFTFTNILEEMRLNGSHCGSSVNSSLSLPNTPNMSGGGGGTRKKNQSSFATNNTVAINEGLGTDVMLPIDPSLMLTSSGGLSGMPRLPSPIDLDPENIPHDLIDEFFNIEKQNRSSVESLGKRRDHALNTPTFELRESNEDIDMSKGNKSLDLTVTGSRIEPPDGWISNPASLALVLGERQDNFDLSDIDLGIGAYDFSEMCDINDENSPRSQGKKNKARRRPGSASSGTDTTSPRRHVTTSNHLMTSSQSKNSWVPPNPLHELQTATDAIQTLLGASFEDISI